MLKNLSGKNFSALDRDLQTAFRRYGVQVIKISSTTHPDVKFEIFERLNTGSVSLSAQELRNCIYRGPLNELIKNLAEEDSFKKVLGLKQAPKRMIHCEMVLRFLAFSEKTHLNYPGKMKSFLNEFMKDYRNVNEQRQNEWSEKFLRACENVYMVFGNKSFRRYRIGTSSNRVGGWETQINKALYDCLMFAFSRLEKRQVIARKDELREAIIELMVNDQEFADAILLGTSDPSRVRTRFEKIRSVIDTHVDVIARERRVFTAAEKQQLFDLDPTCGFCGQRIESIDDAEVDHRVRFSHGGPTTIANARIAHRYCNRADRRAVGTRAGENST